MRSHLRPRRCGICGFTKVGSVKRGRAQSYGVLDEDHVFLDVLCASGRVPDVPEDLAHRRLSQDLADEREGRCQVRLCDIPWHLILPTSVDRLQLVACSCEVCGMLIDVFGSVVYLRPFRR